MKHIFVLLLTLGFSFSAHAQQAKVIKVKGQQAIVQFPSGTKPQVGQIIDLAGEQYQESGAGSMGSGKRSQLLGVSGEISFLNNSVDSKSTTKFSISPKYGWNNGVMEFGPMGTIELTTTDGRSTRGLYAGGFFDFNFTPNQSGQETVYGVGAEGLFGQSSEQVGSGQDQTSSVIRVFGGGNIKWFGLSDSWAIRADGGYYMNRATPSQGSAVTNSGFLVKAGVSTYF